MINKIKLKSPPTKYHTWHQYFSSWSCSRKVDKEITLDLKQRNLQYLTDTVGVTITEKDLKNRKIDIDLKKELSLDDMQSILIAYLKVLKQKYGSDTVFVIHPTFRELLWMNRRVLFIGLIMQILCYSLARSSHQPKVQLSKPNLSPLDFKTAGFLSKPYNFSQPCGGIQIPKFNCSNTIYNRYEQGFLKKTRVITQVNPNWLHAEDVYKLPYSVWRGFDIKEEMNFDKFKVVKTQGGSTEGYVASKLYKICSPKYPLKQIVGSERDGAPVIIQRIPENQKNLDSKSGFINISNFEELMVNNLFLGNERLELNRLMVESVGENKHVVYPRDLSFSGSFSAKTTLRSWFENAFAHKYPDLVKIDLANLANVFEDMYSRLSEKGIDEVISTAATTLQESKMDFSWYEGSPVREKWEQSLKARRQLLADISRGLHLEDAIRKVDLKRFKELFHKRGYNAEGQYHWLMPDCYSALSAYPRLTNVKESNLLTPIQLIKAYYRQELIGGDDAKDLIRFIRVRIISSKQKFPFQEN